VSKSSDPLGDRAELSSANQQQLWMPVGFAHDFLTLSEMAEVLYKASGFWSRSCERSLRLLA
jgi:dTDP-4-dehydrorhamnose 3,5-epimerase